MGTTSPVQLMLSLIILDQEACILRKWVPLHMSKYRYINQEACILRKCVPPPLSNTSIRQQEYDRKLSNLMSNVLLWVPDGGLKGKLHHVVRKTDHKNVFTPQISLTKNFGL